MTSLFPHSGPWLFPQPVGPAPLDRCGKGSIWRVDHDGDDPARLVATYHTPAQIRPEPPIATDP